MQLLCTAHLWIVPAKAEGTWNLPQGELTIQQTFQMISGTLKNGNVVAPVNGKLNGEQISFTAGGTQYTGRVNGNSMEGSAAGSPWTAPNEVRNERSYSSGQAIR